MKKFTNRTQADIKTISIDTEGETSQGKPAWRVYIQYKDGMAAAMTIDPMTDEELAKNPKWTTLNEAFKCVERQLEAKVKEVV